MFGFSEQNIDFIKKSHLEIFHKNITKLVFLWPNMGQKIYKVLSLFYTHLMKHGFNIIINISYVLTLPHCVDNKLL